MRIIRSITFLFLFFLAQTVVFSRLHIFGGGFDLLLTAVIIWGLTQGPLEGFWVGLFCGILMDSAACSSAVFTVSMALTGAGSGILKEKVFKDQEVVMFAAVFLVSLAAYLFQSWMLGYFCHKAVYDLWTSALISSAVNALFVPLVRQAVYKVTDYEQYQ